MTGPTQEAEIPYWDQLRTPKHAGPIGYGPDTIDRIVGDLRELDFDVRDFAIDVPAYRAFVEKAGYRERYPAYYDFNIHEKALEHFIAATLLELDDTDVYIDIASEGSPTPEIYNRLFGCRTLRQDLAYEAGLHGDTIGGDAADLPVPVQYASKLGLHCSFEHFEEDSDSRFVAETARVLRRGGKACIVPLYLFDTYAIQTDPDVAVPQNVEFESDATLYAAPSWGNRHARFYDPQHLATRVRRHLHGLELTIYRIVNTTEAHPTCYAQFAALFRQP